MTEVKKGLLLKLEELKKDFTIEQDKKTTIKINIKVKLRGLAADVYVYGEVSRDEFVRIKKFDVESKSGSIGEIRLKRIVDYLEELFLTEKYLLNNYELDGGYVYGLHNFSKSNSRRESVYLEKVNTEDMELLLEDVQPKEYRRNEHQKRTIYFFNDQLYFRTEEDTKINKAEDFKKEIEKELESLYMNSAIDENGNFYSIVPVNDSNNIRLFDFNRSHKGDEVKTKVTLYRDYSGYNVGNTLKEIISGKEYHNNSVPKEWKDGVLPLIIGDAIIYSHRLIGKDVPLFEENSWVRVNNIGENLDDKQGKYGRVIEQQGTELIVTWEDKYDNKESYINYRYVDKVDNPFSKLEKPIFVAFNKTLHYDDEILSGHGWITESSENISKVVLAKEAELYIKNVLGYHFVINNDSYTNFKSLFEKTFNEKLNYLLVPNDQIAKRAISKAFVSFMTEEKVDEVKYMAIEGLLRMSGKIKKRNLRYFTDLTYFLEKTYKFDNLVKDFCEQVKMASNAVPYSDQIEFEEPEIEEWILKAINFKE
ncbi:hypothetical protein C1N61_29855 (plasmid) [Priestia aryabhattai]